MRITRRHVLLGSAALAGGAVTFGILRRQEDRPSEIAGWPSATPSQTTLSGYPIEVTRGGNINSVFEKDRYVVVTDDKSTRVCSKDTGDEVWNYEVKGVVRDSATVDSTSLVLLESSDSESIGYVHCLGFADGHKNWSTKLDGGLGLRAAFSSESVIIGDQSGTLHCCDRQDGSMRWSVKFPRYISAIWVSQEHGCVYAASVSLLAAVSLPDGEVLWKRDFDGEVTVQSILPDGLLTTISGSLTGPRGIGLIELPTLDLVWSHRMETIGESFLISAKTAIAVLRSSLVAIDLKDGSQVWSRKVQNEGTESHLLGGNLIRLSIRDKALASLSLNGGEEEWRSEVGTVLRDPAAASVNESDVSVFSYGEGIGTWATDTGKFRSASKLHDVEGMSASPTTNYAICPGRLYALRKGKLI